MKKLLGFLILAFCAAHAQAQTVTGQIIANQYDYLIQGFAPNTYQFSGSSCNASGPSGQFAFYVGAPIRIVDGSPTLSETVTPTNVTNTNQTCAISIAPVNNHQLPWHLESGSGGLQEAINLNLSQPATNTIILDNAWYQKLASIGTNAAAVIAAAHGTTNLSLQDVTQAPNTYYTWNGSQYVETTISGQSLATYSVPGLQGGGRCFVYPSSISTDAFAAFNACSAQLPSAGGLIDATALGTANYAVSTPLTALNNSNQAVILLLNPGTTFTINTSFATPTNSPASCAVPIGPGTGAVGSGIIVPGHNSFGGNFILGASARVWDVLCNGNFTGNQETMRLDGVTVQGNASATVMGALIHLAGIFTPTRITNSGTYLCFAQCWEIDAGTTGTGGPALGDLLFDNDLFQDGNQGSQTYPGSVLRLDALTSSGEVENLTFLGGMVQLPGPHNPLLVIDGRGGGQTSSIGFFGTTFQGAAATPSIYNSNVDPIQLTDVSSFLISNLRFSGTNNTSSQPNLVDIFGTVQNAQYGINIDQISGFTGSFTCLVKNNVEGTCDAGFPAISGVTAMPNYTFGQVFPQIRLTNIPAPTSVGVCIVGSAWTNSADATAGAFKVCQGAPGSQVYTTIGGSGTTSFQVNGTPVSSGATINFINGTNTTVSNPGGAGNIRIDAPSPGAATFPALGGGTNTGSAFVCGSGCSFGTAGSGTNTATSVPYSGVSGVPTAASGTLGVSSPDNVTIAATTGVYHIISPGASTILGFSSANGYIGYTAGTNISLAGGQISNTSTANTVSGSMTTPCITLATGAHSIGCANATDNGTQFSITEALNVGGTGPGLATPTAANVSSNPLPTCNSGSVNTLAVVSDLNTTPTFWLAYAGNSGGNKTAPVVCAFDGSAYAWRVY